MHKRVRHAHDPPFVDHRRHTDRAMGCIGVENRIDPLKDMCRLARGTCHETIAMTMRQHQRRKDMPVARGEPVDIVMVISTAL